MRLFVDGRWHAVAISVCLWHIVHGSIFSAILKRLTLRYYPFIEKWPDDSAFTPIQRSLVRSIPDSDKLADKFVSAKAEVERKSAVFTQEFAKGQERFSQSFHSSSFKGSGKFNFV
jgi:hypothetical protein